MKLDHPDTLAMLADEYVLGTLRGRARRRFEKVCAADEAAARAVRDAEDRMLAVSLALDPVTPSESTWEAVVALTGGRRRRDSARLMRSRWPIALAAVVTMAALGLAWFMLQQPTQPDSTANVAAEGGAQLWTVETYAGGARLRAQATGPVATQPGHSYELWALPEGGAPVSLGLMPESGGVERDLTDAQRAALQLARKVAVSLEPAGGSKTGAPTGPVLYVSAITRTG